MMGLKHNSYHMILKQIPNAFTFFRCLIIIPFLFLLHQHVFTGAFYLFLFAGLSDCLDGWIARTFNWQSSFGSFLDPAADKLLVAASFISLTLLNKLPAWLVALVFLRDLTISLGVLAWYYFIRQEINFKPTLLSKMNTFLQLSLVVFCLFELAFFEVSAYINDILIGLTALTTAATYLDYVLTWSKKACTTGRPLAK